MGLCYADLKIANARLPELSPLNVRALADTGALHLCIPQHVALQLQLSELEKREVTLADGSKHALPYVGPIHLTFGNRSGFMGAIVLGDEVLLGAIAMEILNNKIKINEYKFSNLNTPHPSLLATPSPTRGEGSNHRCF
jgi:clan AA aspartic protease